MTDKLSVGDRARFFHPLTFGVMYSGIVIKVISPTEVLVKFDIDDQKHITYHDHIIDKWS